MIYKEQQETVYETLGLHSELLSILSSVGLLFSWLSSPSTATHGELSLDAAREGIKIILVALHARREIHDLNHYDDDSIERLILDSERIITILNDLLREN